MADLAQSRRCRPNELRSMQFAGNFHRCMNRDGLQSSADPLSTMNGNSRRGHLPFVLLPDLFLRVAYGKDKRRFAPIGCTYAPWSIARE